MRMEAGGSGECVCVWLGMRVCVRHKQQVRQEGESSPADDEDLLSLRPSNNCPLRSSMPFSWCLTSLEAELSSLHAFVDGDAAGTTLRTDRDMLAACRRQGKEVKVRGASAL